MVGQHEATVKRLRPDLPCRLRAQYACLRPLDRTTRSATTQSKYVSRVI
jgi:hypothetical protein